MATPEDSASAETEQSSARQGAMQQLMNERSGGPPQGGQSGSSEPDATSEGKETSTGADADGNAEATSSGEATESDDRQAEGTFPEDASPETEENADSSESDATSEDDVIEIDEDALPERFRGQDEIDPEDLTDEEYEALVGEARETGPWYETEAGSVYASAEEAQKGLDAKDEYISKLESRLESGEAEGTEAQAELAAYKDFMPEEELTNLLVQRQLPEEFQGVDPDSITDDEFRGRYDEARRDAEWEVEKMKRERKEEAKKARQRQAEAEEEAERYAEEALSPSAFDIDRPEKESKLQDRLEEETEDGRTVREDVRLVRQIFGESVADMLTRGIKEDFWDDTRENVGKQVLKIKTKASPKPTERTKEPPEEETKPLTPKEMGVQAILNSQNA